MMQQEQPANEVTTNDEYNSQADWQPESSSSLSILQGNDTFGCLNEDDQLHELDLQDWDFTQALPSSLLITSESDCVLDTTTTTQYSIEVENKEDTATSPILNIESKYQQANIGRPRFFKYRG